MIFKCYDQSLQTICIRINKWRASYDHVKTQDTHKAPKINRILQQWQNYINYLDLVTNQPTKYPHEFLPEKLTGSQLVKRYSANYMEPESSLPHPQHPATCPYPETDQSNSCPHIPLLLRLISILSYHLSLGPPRVLSPSG
jgi:hypothetical protein